MRNSFLFGAEKGKGGERKKILCTEFVKRRKFGKKKKDRQSLHSKVKGNRER